VAAAQPASASRYLHAAITGEVRRVATAPPGRRNHALFLAAVALGQLAGAGALDQQQASDLLLDAARPHVEAGAFTTHEALATIRSGLTRGMAEPRHLPTSTSTARGAA
jgi:hypothetical protein